MSFDDKIPIYIQLVDLMEQDIAAGIYKAGDKLASRRDLAEKYKVNPNTVQRAFKEMEERGMVETVGNQASFVTSDEDKIANLRQGLIQEATDRYFDQVQALGVSAEEILAYLREHYPLLEEENDYARD